MSENLKSFTIYAYFDGLLHKITACEGTWEIVMDAGQIAKINWTFKGFYQTPIDEALPSGVVYDSPVPPVVLNAGFKINNVSTLVVQSVAVALNNVISQRDDVNAASAIKGFLITDRAGGGSFNPEAVLKATYDFYGDWEEATARALEITIGSTPGNIIEIAAPKVTLDNITPGDRDGIRVFDIPFSLAEDSGDDEISITFK
ncbi:MAG: phage tail tube protein [Candidatus Asgardarchaeum sp.]